MFENRPKRYPQNHLERNTGPLKILKKNCLFQGCFSEMKSFQTLINHYSKIWANIFYFQKNEVKPTFIYKITGRRSCHFVSPIFGNVTLIKRDRIVIKYQLLKACLESKWKSTWKLDVLGQPTVKWPALWVFRAITWKRSFLLHLPTW